VKGKRLELRRAMGRRVPGNEDSPRRRRGSWGGYDSWDHLSKKNKTLPISVFAKKKHLLLENDDAWYSKGKGETQKELID